MSTLEVVNNTETSTRLKPKETYTNLNNNDPDHAFTGGAVAFQIQPSKSAGEGPPPPGVAASYLNLPTDVVGIPVGVVAHRGEVAHQFGKKLTLAHTAGVVDFRNEGPGSIGCGAVYAASPMFATGGRNKTCSTQHPITSNRMTEAYMLTMEALEALGFPDNGGKALYVQRHIRESKIDRNWVVAQLKQMGRDNVHALANALRFLHTRRSTDMLDGEQVGALETLLFAAYDDEYGGAGDRPDHKLVPLINGLDQKRLDKNITDFKVDAKHATGAPKLREFKYGNRQLPFPSVIEHFCSPDFNATTYALTILYRGYHMNDLRDHYLQAMSSFSLGKYIASKGSADSSIQPRKSGTVLLGKQVN